MRGDLAVLRVSAGCGHPRRAEKYSLSAIVRQSQPEEAYDDPSSPGNS
jgi:hypothetical protein